jgi:hypothetical protein
VLWVAPEQGVSLHWCKDTRYSASKRCRELVNTAIDKFRNSKICEQGMHHLFINVRGLNSYSGIKWVEVLDVPCVGDDVPSSYWILYVPGRSTSWMMNGPSQGGDNLCLSLLP